MRQSPRKNAGFVENPWGGPQGFRQTCAETKVICSCGIAGWANCVTNRFCAQAVLQKGFAAQVVAERVAVQSCHRTRRRRHLVARRGPSLGSSSCVGVFARPEKVQNGDLVWPACVPSGVFAWTLLKGRVGNTYLQ